MVTSLSHQNIAQFGTLQITLMPSCDLCMVSITQEQDFLIFIFQFLGQWGSLDSVILLQIQGTSIIFNLHIITAEFCLLQLLLQNSSDSLILQVILWSCIHLWLLEENKDEIRSENNIGTELVLIVSFSVFPNLSIPGSCW